MRSHPTCLVALILLILLALPSFAQVPAAPRDLTATTSGTSITLSWLEPGGATSYKIERKTNIGGTYAQIGTAASGYPHYTDATGTIGTIYYYRVRGNNASGDGPYSNEYGVFLTTTSNDTGYTLDFTYDHFGNLIQTTAGTIVTSLGYDLRGRKTSTSDPDMGNWSYVYNALGELIRQTDAKNQTVTMTYDLLGRMTNRTELDLVSNWTYDSCVKGVGKLCQATGTNSYSRMHSYDSFGRASQISVTYSTVTYTVSYGYDTASRLSQITYPTGFIAKNVYNAFGYLQKITDSTGTLSYWQANTVSATARILNETLGNSLTTTRSYDTLDRLTSNAVTSATGALQNFSYSYDDVGNVTQRVDNVQAVTENFYYDLLNRLELSSGPGLTTKTYSFDPHGNIISKSDVGNYTYGAKPHAVASVAGTVNASYLYDANGNMTSGNGRTVTYSSYNMPATVNGNGKTYSYNYNPEHERVQLTHSTLGTFVYIHPAGKGQLLYEKVTPLTGPIEHKHYLTAGSRVVAVYLSRSDSTTETRYFHQDHLSSIALVTDASGAILERLAYDVAGKRRFPNGADDPTNTISGQKTQRGFTGHEHLDDITLIHMNGRIYDPVIQRFVTADPTNQDQFNLQAYNRYSYAFNNPLAYLDPTGYWGFCLCIGNSGLRIGSGGVSFQLGSRFKVAGNWRHIAAIGAALAAPYFASEAMLTGAANAAAAAPTLSASTGFATAGIGMDAAALTPLGTGLSYATGGFSAGLISSGGDLRAAAKAGIMAGFTAGLGAVGSDLAGAGGSIVGRAVGTGLGTELTGGRFADGFKQGLRDAAVTTGAAAAYTTLTHYDPTPSPGVDMPGNAEERQTYRPESDGRLPITSQGMDIVGLNAPFTGSPLDAFKQGGSVMRFLNSVLGINAIAGADDFLQNRISNSIGNFSYALLPITIPAALYVTVPALLEPAPSLLHARY